VVVSAAARRSGAQGTAVRGSSSRSSSREAAGRDRDRAEAGGQAGAQKAPRGRSGRLKDSLSIPFHLTWVTTAILLVAGLCMMLSISTAVTSGDKFGYLRNQGITAAVGVCALVILSRVDYRRLRTWSVVFLGVVVFSLLLVHVPGVARSEGGSASWIPMGPLTFQPSEFAKLAVVLVGAHLLTSPRVSDGRFWSYMWPFGLTCLGICVLVYLEGDLGTAIIIAGLMMGMLWLGGMKAGQWTLVCAAGIAGAVGLTLMSTVRTSRVLSFLDPSSDPQKSSYQLTQSLVALGKGGWFGVGPGQSVQKFQYLPKARSDMIFAILGEEFGLVGAGLIIALFGVFAIACWRLARRCGDPMGKLLIAGCGMLIILQAAVNIGGVIGALPLTGVPLPFISYGRNSLLVMLLAVGLILAVCKRAPVAAARSEGERYDNVTHLDRRRWDGRARSARAGAR
jgi:cell division protein FtsW